MLKTSNNETDLLSGFSEQQAQQIKKALDISAPLRSNAATPNSGLDVAMILLQYNVDQETLLAALLSDPALNNKLEYAAIADDFGYTVADLVKDVIWLNTQQVYSPEMTQQPDQAETLRRMLLSMTHDVRAVLIKLAVQVFRMRNWSDEDKNIRQFIAQETLDIYAPIANRLGIAQLKWELEDLSFRYLKPQQYKSIAKSLAEKRHQREICISGFIFTLQQVLSNAGIKAEIAGRPKHLYSIWKKMQRKQLGIDELYDLLAVRVIVDQISSCYAVLGIVHGEWQYIPKEFDDYIANPKENGYQSLHTVIHDQQGNRIEVQIRTREMHDFAELGVAAHWRYKEGGKHNQSSEKSISSLRRLLEDKDSDEGLVASFRSELFYDRVYALTPAGKLIDLVKGSTPLDFAYAVHTQVGHRCRGAKVNGRIVPLTYELQSGEQVEILTAKKGEPNHNWINPNLGYVKSPRTISKIKAWFKKQHIDYNLDAGKQILENECQRLGLDSIPLKELSRFFKLANSETLYAAIGCGDINAKQIANFLQTPVAPAKSKKPKVKSDKVSSSVTVDGVENILTNFAQCCQPQPGDNIIGFISQTKGITVHKSDCQNITQLEPLQQQKLIDVSWGNQSPNMAISIVISAYNKQGLLNEVIQIVNALKIDILNARFDIEDDLTGLLKLDILVKDFSQLSQVLGKIGQLPNVIDVKRSV